VDRRRVRVAHSAADDDLDVEKVACDCPLIALREACRDFFQWESILFGSGVKLTQDELDAASRAYDNARDRIRSMVMEDE
jgi:hypothetical protein